MRFTADGKAERRVYDIYYCIETTLVQDIQYYEIIYSILRTFCLICTGCTYSLLRARRRPPCGHAVYKLASKMKIYTSIYYISQQYPQLCILIRVRYDRDDARVYIQYICAIYYLCNMYTTIYSYYMCVSYTQHVYIYILCIQLQHHTI